MVILYEFIENGSIGGYVYDNEIFGKKTADSSIEILKAILKN
jgi:hypothetical protein